MDFQAKIAVVVKQAAIYFFGLMALVLGVLSLYTVFGDSVSIPSANLISYTAIVFWFIFMGSKWLGGGYSLHNKAIQRTIPRLLAIHAGFLVLILAVQSLAFSSTPRLPADWLLEHGKDPSWFVSGLMVIFVLIGTVQTYLSRRILSRSIGDEKSRDSMMI
jgi:hypothetical protein